jgi:predicted phosphodiesterase
MNKTQLVEGYIRKYCDNNNELTIPKQTLSRLIYNENHGLFSGIDAVRNIVRSLTGSNKTNTKALPGFTQPSTIEDGLRKYKLFTKLPEPKEKILKPGCWLVMSDIHFPEHDPTAIAASLNFAKNARVDGIVLNGDIIDMYEVSRFIKEVGRPSIKTELEMTRSFFQLLRDEFGDIPIVYKFGNHEERMRNYLLTNARAIAELDGIGLEDQLQLKKFGIDVVYRERIRAGKLDILHGHELQKGISAPVNPARGAFLRAKSSLLIGHHHQTSTHHENNLKRDQIVCYSIGCHCTLTPEYNPFGYTRQNHGGAIVEILKGGNFKVNNYRIINGSVY